MMSARFGFAALSLALTASIGALGFEPARADDPAPRSTKSTHQKSRLTRDESEAKADKRKLLLSSGEDRAIDLDFEEASSNGVTVGNPSIVAYTLVKMGDKRQIVFKPLKKGETNVALRDASGELRLIFQVTVTDSNLLRRAGEIRELLRDIEGIDIKIVGQKIVVDGEVIVPTDYARVLSVTSDESYKNLVMNLTILSPMALQMLAKKIEEDVKAFAPDVNTRVVNGVIFLEGSVDSKDKADRAAEIAKLYLPEAKPPNPLLAKDDKAQFISRPGTKNFIVITPPPPRKADRLVRVTVHFVKLGKDYSKIFGFKWQPGYTSSANVSVGNTGDGSVGASGSSFAATISNLFPKLQSAQNAGYARVLKTGTIIVKSGEPGRLSEEMQIPFTGIDANGRAATEFRNVGLAVAVTPKILGQSDDIEMNLDLKQVSIVTRGVGGRAPSTASHAVNTLIYVKSTESAAVAGVNSSDVSTNFNKDDPREGQFEAGTDALFTLLRSKNYSKSKSQFVIFVTPQIIENASDGTDDLKKNFRVKVK